ncbi:hypothetical protein GCM10011505_08760 [Tistrella bauzanensis]|uniref:Uncharacterized protein n=1 Tax=Tistrella bauzanensis TaxID=657419 RepID=A0ABQ1IAS2_9PROT|nr:hypothetical protein GCM10011505_08760 [Tistrella bauzanensis]
MPIAIDGAGIALGAAAASIIRSTARRYNPGGSASARRGSARSIAGIMGDGPI